AGLTHGGFYGHFKDREDLIAQAVVQAARDSMLAGDKPGIEALRSYLSTDHALHPERGCVVAALGGEAAPQKGAVRAGFAEIGRRFLGHVERRIHPEAKKDGPPSDEALVAASRIVGAIVLARLVQDEALAERILEATKSTL